MHKFAKMHEAALRDVQAKAKAAPHPIEEGFDELPHYMQRGILEAKAAGII